LSIVCMPTCTNSRHVDVQTTENLRAQAEAPICPPNLTTLQYYSLPRLFVGKLATTLGSLQLCPEIIHLVSKNVPPLAFYNFDICERIMMFLTDVLPIKQAMKRHFTMPHQVTYSSALAGKTEKRKSCTFRSNAVLVHCLNSTSCLISSIFLTHDSYSCCCMTPLVL